MLTRAVALHCAEQGYDIRVNTILPGAIHTEMVEGYVAAGIAAGGTREAVLEGFAGVHPMKRLGRPDEAANAIVFLASDESSYTTGGDLPVDGGYLALKGRPMSQARRPLDQVNPFDPELLQDPYPYFAQLREEAPVYRHPATGVVSVATYDLIMEVNRQPLVFSNDFGAQLRSGAPTQQDPEEMAIMMQGVPVANTMLTADPPAHTRYRKLSGQAFTYKRVEGMGDYVAQVTNDLIDRFAADGRCEFKSAFANHLPMTVIADALGAPREDMDRFHRWSEAFVAQLGGVSDRGTRLEAARRIVEFQRYFIDRIEEKRATPTEDIISDLVHADLAAEGDPRRWITPSCCRSCSSCWSPGTRRRPTP